MYNILCKIWQFFASIKDSILYKDCDFATWMVPEELIGHEDKGNKYQPSTDSLKKVLKKMKVTNKDSIIDIGCGKGKALYIMSRFPFFKVGGYDLSKDLVEIAKTNLAKLKVKNVDVFVADANEYKDYDDYNYFYLFNSIPEKVFNKAIVNIKKSLDRKPRNCTFIYLNPVCDEAVKKIGFKEFYNYKSLIKWFNYRCYKYEVGDSNEKN